MIGQAQAGSRPAAVRVPFPRSQPALQNDQSTVAKLQLNGIFVAQITYEELVPYPAGFASRYQYAAISCLADKKICDVSEPRRQKNFSADHYQALKELPKTKSKHPARTSGRRRGSHVSSGSPKGVSTLISDTFCFQLRHFGGWKLANKKNAKHPLGMPRRREGSCLKRFTAFVDYPRYT